MKTANVATLKQNLSEYLRFVEQGDEVLVTSHRRHIARLVPEHGTGPTIRAPTLPLSALDGIRGVKLAKPFSAEQALLADRGRR
jgi:prevent-host-death family protein